MLDFDRLISQHLRRETRPKQPGRYYPSEIGSCLRKVWYSYKHPKPTEMDMIKIFEVGNIMHDFMAEVLRSERTPEVELLKSELPIKIQEKDFLISGRIDDLLLIKASGKQMLLEVKSTKFLGFVEKQGPQTQHVMQLQLYMRGTGVNHGILLYIEKATLRTRAFFIEYDRKKAEEALHRFHNLHHHVVTDSIPEPEARTTRRKEIGWMCNNCDWQKECYEETPQK